MFDEQFYFEPKLKSLFEPMSRFYKKDDGGSKTTTSSPYTPEQQDWISKALELYGPTLGQGANVYPGERVAGFTDTQQGTLGSLGSFADYFGGGGEMPMYAQTGDALKNILAGTAGADPWTSQQTSDYFKSAYQQPAMKQWSEFIKPEIKENYAGPGYWSSARAGAVAEGARDLGDWLGAKHGQLQWDTATQNKMLQESAANRMLSGIGQGMQYGMMPTQEMLSKLGGLGGVFDFAGAGQQQNQAEINAAIQKWAEEQAITDPANLSILMAFLNQPYGGTIQTTRPTQRSWDTMDWVRLGMGALGAL